MRKTSIYWGSSARCTAILIAALAVLPFLAAGQGGRGQGSGGLDAAMAMPTPHTADGKPDLSGYWGGLMGDGAKLADPGSSIVQGTAHGDRKAFGDYLTHFEQDAQLGQRAQMNRPVYKPEYWGKIRATDWDYSRKNDPEGNCLPALPRLGAPQKIVQLPDEIIFFYEALNRYRIIPTDGRTHDPIKSGDPTWLGDSVAHWEGDTLVIDTIGLVDQSWLGPTGYIHTEDTHVIERVQRTGNVLKINTTVEDPMLLQPWQMNPIVVRLNSNPKAVLWEELPCEERDNRALGGDEGK